MRDLYAYRRLFTTIPADKDLPFPRVSAHRGMCGIAPENSLPAFGAAMAVGAEEIELDLYLTADGEVVTSHDCTLDRVSDGSGLIWEHTLAELKTLDLSRGDPRLAGTRIPTFGEVLATVSRRVIVNVHIKYFDGVPYPVGDIIDRVLALLCEYGCEDYAYILCDSDDGARYIADKCPSLGLCALTGKNVDVVARAKSIGTKRVTIDKYYFTPELVGRAKDNGLIVNVGAARTAEETIKFLSAGADTVLADDLMPVMLAVERFRRNEK